MVTATEVPTIEKVCSEEVIQIPPRGLREVTQPETSFLERYYYDPALDDVLASAALPRDMFQTKDAVSKTNEEEVRPPRRPFEGLRRRAFRRHLMSQDEAERETARRFKAIAEKIPLGEELVESLWATEEESSDTPMYFNPPVATQMLPEPLSRYRPPPIMAVSNEFGLGDAGLTLSRSVNNRAMGYKIGNSKASASNSVALHQRRVSTAHSFKDFSINTMHTLQQQEVGVGAKYKKYGVAVVRNNEEDGTAVEVSTPYVVLGTIANFLDRNYGQKIKVNDLEVIVRHDFDEHEYQDPKKLATEFLVSYKDTGVAVGSDLMDTKYGVSIGVKGYQVSVLRDFDERQTDLEGNWGDGWQIYLSHDSPDNYSEYLWTRVGFGKLDQAYVVAGAGVGDDGVPEFNAQFQTRRAAFMIDLEGGGGGSKSLLTGFSFGKYTYIWDSKIVLDNLRIPLLFGIEPYSIKNLLTPGMAKNPHSK